MRTHLQSQVESNPVQSDSQRHGSDSVAYWHWPPRPCIHTSRVKSSPIQSSQTHKDAAVTLWLTDSGHRGHAYTPAESSQVQSSPVRLTETWQWLCGLLTVATAAVHTHQQSQVQSSPTSLAEWRVLMPHISFLSVRLQWSCVTAAILRNKWMWKSLLS